MHVLVLALASLLSGPLALAKPISHNLTTFAEGATLQERQNADRICGDQNAYSTSYQNQVFVLAQDYEISSTTALGSNNVRYPHDFRNDEQLVLPDCPGVPAPFREFPILPGGKPFQDGADPQTDRIIYKVTGDDASFAYCGVITHIGAPAGGFVDCTDA